LGIGLVGDGPIETQTSSRPALAHLGILRNQRERGEDPDLDRVGRVFARRHRA